MEKKINMKLSIENLDELLDWAEKLTCKSNEIKKLIKEQPKVKVGAVTEMDLRGLTTGGKIMTEEAKKQEYENLNIRVQYGDMGKFGKRTTWRILITGEIGEHDPVEAARIAGERARAAVLAATEK